MNIFTQPGIAVITTNTVGAMGAGIAKQAAQLYPRTVGEYRYLLKSGRHAIGLPAFSTIAPVLYFATKRDWRNPSEYAYVEESLNQLRVWCLDGPIMGDQDLWFPPLGCGLGGLDRKVVRDLFDLYLGEFPYCHAVGF